MTQPSEAENGGWVVDPPKPAEEKSAKVIAEKKAEGEGDGEPVLVKDGYVKANHVLWDWPNLLSAWQRNAVMGLVKADALCHPDNPLYSQEKKGIELYVCTDSSGKETPCFSLKQLEYIQYYIHENRMADPAWIAHLAKINTATKAEREAGTVPKMEDAGPTEYPSGQEWVNLPDAIRPAEEFEHIEPIVFNDPSALKKYLNKMAKIAKQKEAIKMVAMAPEDRPELDDEMAALVDNATPGPGLRRGPGKSHDRRPPVFRWDGGEDAPATDSQTGWGGFPLEQADEPVADAAPISQEEDFANRTRALIEDILPQATQTPPDEVEEEGQDGEASEQPTTFSEQYFSQSQHALMYASVGGLFAANRAKDQSASLDKIAELAAAPPIGRGLFISINVTTWDEDNSVILDVGWSAIWWQFGVENKDEVEEMRDGGHFIVQDHVLGKHNGKVRPDKRSDFLYGNSLPIPLSAFNNTIDTTIKALQNRAGGGTTYLVYHSNDQEYSDLEKIGIKTKDWYRQLKPSGWDYPAYACADGIGNVFVIDTAILFAAIEFDTTAPPVPVKTKKSLLEIVTLTASGFGNDVTSVGWGNSGNDAFNNLQMFLSMMTDHTLETWRLIYNMSQLASSFGLTDADAPTDVEDEQEEPNGDKAKITAEAEANDDDVDADAESVYSEDEMMAGVYYDGDDGDLVKLDDEDDVGPEH